MLGRQILPYVRRAAVKPSQKKFGLGANHGLPRRERLVGLTEAGLETAARHDYDPQFNVRVLPLSWMADIRANYRGNRASIGSVKHPFSFGISRSNLHGKNILFGLS